MTTIFEHFDKVIEIERVVPNAYKKFKNYETLRTLETGIVHLVLLPVRQPRPMLPR